MAFLTRSTGVLFAALITLILWTGFRPLASDKPVLKFSESPSYHQKPFSRVSGSSFRWEDVPQKYKASTFTPLPAGSGQKLPQIQHDFKAISGERRGINKRRLEAVRGNFTHAWQGYKKYAWLKDEVRPLSGASFDPFGGWAATLVDTLGMTPSLVELF